MGYLLILIAASLVFQAKFQVMVLVYLTYLEDLETLTILTPLITP
jgi:hypothetical protein